MNGIGLVIPGADFSGSPLGKVTIVESPLERATEVVNDYVARTNVSDVQTLINFVSQLMVNNLWDKVLSFFPMLGDSIDAKLVDLKNPTRSAWKAGNFTSVEGGIFVANNIDAGLPPNDLWHDSCPFAGFAIATAFKIDNIGNYNVHPVYPKNFKNTNDGNTVLTINSNTLAATMGIKSQDNLLQAYFGGNIEYSLYSGVSPKDASHRYIGFNSPDGKMHLITDGDDDYISYDKSNRSNLNLYPIFGVNQGYESGEAVSNLNDNTAASDGLKYGQVALDGIIYAIGFANLETMAEITLFDTLFGTFLHDSGKIL